MNNKENQLGLDGSGLKEAKTVELQIQGQPWQVIHSLIREGRKTTQNKKPA